MLFAGVKITVEGEELIVPPLSLGQLRNGVLTDLQEHDKLLAEGKTFELMDLRGKVILAALRRNYPDFSEEKLMAYLDMGNTTPLWFSILGISGFTPGEAPAAIPKANGT